MMMMMFITISARDQSSQGRRRIWAFERRSAKAWQQRYSWPLPALSHWDVKVGGTSMEEMRVPCFAGSSPPFLGRERAAVDVDVGPDRRSPRYHETVFLLRVLKTAARRYVNRDVCVTGCACCVVQNVRKRSSPGARVETTGAAARNESARKCWRWPARIPGDGLTAMVPIQLPVLGNLACRLLVKVLVWVAWVKQLSVAVPVPRRSARRSRASLADVTRKACLTCDEGVLLFPLLSRTVCFCARHA